MNIRFILVGLLKMNGSSYKTVFELLYGSQLSEI